MNAALSFLGLLDAGDREPRYTIAFQLTPASLVSTAAADIAKHERNRMAQLAPKHKRPHMERLGFFPGDVHGALGPEEVISSAIRRCQGAKEGLKLKQRNRRLLYDLPLLIEAERIARQRGQHQ